MEIHTDLKPFVCNICGHATRLKESLLTHKRIHTGKCICVILYSYFEQVKPINRPAFLKSIINMATFVASVNYLSHNVKSHSVL